MFYHYFKENYFLKKTKKFGAKLTRTNLDQMCILKQITMMK